MHLHPFYITCTVIDVLAVVAVLGLLACWLGVLPQMPVPAIDAAMSRLIGMAIALLTVSSFGILGARSLELDGGQWVALLPTLPLALKVTHFGHVWLLRLPALCLLWFGWKKIGRRRRRAWPAWVMIAAAAAIALARSETGHAADHGDFTLAVWVDWVHLVAGSVWVGSLFGMSLVVFPRLLSEAQRPPLRAAEIFQRLSALSGLALGAVLVSGAYTAWHELQSWSSLWTSQYGRILTVKLLLVAGMIALGARNRYGHLPCLLRLSGRSAQRPLLLRLLGTASDGYAAQTPDEGSVVRRCARTVHLESLLGMGVILAASMLLHSMPASEMRDMPVARLRSRPLLRQHYCVDIGIWSRGNGRFWNAACPAGHAQHAILTNSSCGWHATIAAGPARAYTAPCSIST